MSALKEVQDVMTAVTTQLVVTTAAVVCMLPYAFMSAESII